MSFNNSLLTLKSLRSKLILWILLISLIPLGIVTFLSYEESKHILLKHVTEDLKSLNARAARFIEFYYDEQEKIAAVLAKDFVKPQTLEKLKTALNSFGSHSPEYLILEQEFDPSIPFKIDILISFNKLFLVTLDGDVVYSTSSSTLLGKNLLNDPKVNKQLKKIFLNAKDSLQTTLSNIIPYDDIENPSAFIATPILSQDVLSGIMITQIDNTPLFQLITNHTGLGETGETILIAKLDDDIILQSPLRNESSEQIIHTLPSNSSFGVFIQQILDGKRLAKTVIDSRNQKTLMVGRSLIPSLNLAIITKIDMKELLAPINQLLIASWVMSLISAACVIYAAVHFSNMIIRPILIMTKKTRLMASGDLSQRIEFHDYEEVTKLSQSFNDMAMQLDNMIQHLDTIVAKRTEEIEQQNTKLENTIEELQKAQDRLINQEKLASLGALTAGIAHEIKNPLNFINNFAELSLQIDSDMEERLEKIKNQIAPEDASLLHEYLETLKTNINKIYDHGKRADSIVRNMLYHSRETQSEMVPTDINALLNEFIPLSYHGMRALDPSFNLKIEKNLDPNLPQITISPQEISRVILNLLNNAFYSVNVKKKDLKDEYTPIVRVTTSSRDNLVVISIWDNGYGISEKIFPKLFTPFFTTKPVGEGTGLGLSLSYNIIVQGHQGTLTATSKFGEFAEFVITLPVSKKIESKPRSI
ncbi:MAG: HAMP domain-containing protein [Parachlamydiaceae bacterium]|nr:HAMP domain-containing protein [Parachlamydiaceae bacterium]